MTEAPRPPGQPEPDPTGPPPPSYSAPDPSAAPGYTPPPQPQQPYPAAPPPPGGYAPPPGDYAPPPGDYAAGPGVAPPGYATNDEKNWALIAHFGGALGAFVGAGGGGWIAPLVAMLTKGNESPTVRAHAIAALNFQLTMTIAAIIGWSVGCLLLFIPGFVVMAVAVIFGIVGGVKANEGTLYKYPLTINLVK
jgi:uncharacterized Tic20 family protein